MLKNPQKSPNQGTFAGDGILKLMARAEKADMKLVFFSHPNDRESADAGPGYATIQSWDGVGPNVREPAQRIVDEAMTLSAVSAELAGTFNPWTDAEPLASRSPVLRGADRLRLSLVPSLLEACRTNQALSNPRIELFEIAKVYLPRGKKLPDEQQMLGLCSGRSFEEVKGVIEATIAALDPAATLETTGLRVDLLAPARCCKLLIDGQVLGFLGQLRPEGLKQFDLRPGVTVAELKTSLLVKVARRVPTYTPLPAYPAVSRDLNLVVDERVRWADIARTVAAKSRPYFEELQYQDTYRDEKRLGADKKSLLMRLVLRSGEGTMTNQQADELRDQIVAACRREHGAELRA